MTDLDPLTSESLLHGSAWKRSGTVQVLEPRSAPGGVAAMRVCTVLSERGRVQTVKLRKCPPQSRFPATSDPQLAAVGRGSDRDEHPHRAGHCSVDVASGALVTPQRSSSDGGSRTMSASGQSGSSHAPRLSSV